MSIPLSSRILNTFHHYFISGILEANIVPDGGPICHAEIPPVVHISACIGFSIFFIMFFYKYHHSLLGHSYRVQLKPNVIELLAAFLGLLSFILTAYSKIISRKGMFILNPCHLCLLMQVILLASPNNTTPFLRKMHTAWSAWLYGAILALLVPHLDGVTYSGILIYYYEHLLIMPIGPLLLYRRYGFTMPNIVNQISSYATMCLYQLLMLAPIGRITMVNLNFALCHTSADPSYSLFGYHYFTFMAMFLCVVSAVARWIAWAYVRIIYGKDKYIVKANTQTKIN